MANKKRPNIMMCLAFVLLCLTLVTTHLTGGLYAKYVAKDSAEDSARVAKFDVDITTGESQTYTFHPEVKIQPGISEITRIHIANSNEVAVSVTVRVSNETLNIPLEFLIAEIQENNQSNQNNEVVYHEAKAEKTFVVYPDSDYTHDLVVVSKWDSANSIHYMGMVDLIEIEVHVEQID